jgi:hypothetical protein
MLEMRAKNTNLYAYMLEMRAKNKPVGLYAGDACQIKPNRPICWKCAQKTQTYMPMFWRCAQETQTYRPICWRCAQRDKLIGLYAGDSRKKHNLLAYMLEMRAKRQTYMPICWRCAQKTNLYAYMLEIRAKNKPIDLPIKRYRCAILTEHLNVFTCLLFIVCVY